MRQRHLVSAARAAVKPGGGPPMRMAASMLAMTRRCALLDAAMSARAWRLET